MTPTYQNPNRALRKPARQHPGLTVVRRILVVLLAVLLTVSLFLTLCIAGIRATVTPEFVYRFAESISYVELPLPVDGEYVTIVEMLQEVFQDINLPFSTEDVVALFDQFSIPTVVASVAQDLVSWLLHDGPRPALDSYEIADIVLSRLDSSIYSLLQLFGDPAALLGDVLEEQLSAVSLEELLTELEPVRQLLSQKTLSLLASLSGILALLVFFACLCRLSGCVLPLGASASAVGLALFLASRLLPLYIPRITTEYAALLADFCAPVTACLLRYAVTLLLVGLLLVGVGTLLLLLSGRQNGNAAGRMPSQPYQR